MSYINYSIVLGLTALLSTASFGWKVIVKNELPPSPVCIHSGNSGNSLKLFYSVAGKVQALNMPPNSTHTFNDMSFAYPPLGIQINNWYWIQTLHAPTKTGDNQNPDNSGAELSITPPCTVKLGPAWSGKGIQTWLVSKITWAYDASQQACVVTVAENEYTNAVTPGCCSPQSCDAAKGAVWGVTETHKKWPPDPTR